jgi:uncharacterized protein YkwD
LRALHGVPALKMNNSINAIAQNYAQYLASKNLFQHSNARGLGENLAMISSSNAYPMTDCSCILFSFFI